MGLDDSDDPHILIFAEGHDRIPKLVGGEIGVQTSILPVGSSDARGLKIVMRGVENTITKIESVVGSLLDCTVPGSGLEITKVDLQLIHEIG